VLLYGRLLGEVHGLDAQTHFLNLYTQESEASAAHLMAETARIERETADLLATSAQQAAQQDTTAQALGGVIVAVVLFWIFYAMSR
jgi:hypothetical protein